MEVFGIIGMSLGTMGFVFGIILFKPNGETHKNSKRKENS